MLSKRKVSVERAKKHMTKNKAITIEDNKVLILVNQDNTIYNFRRELVERLLADGFKVYISSPYGKRLDEFKKQGCQIIHTAMQQHGLNPIDDCRLFLRYYAIVKKIRPSVILTYTIKPNIYGSMAAQFTKTPYMVNITGLGNALGKQGLLQKALIFLYRYALKKVSYIYFQNQENMDFFTNKKIVNKNKILLPGSGVNLKHYSLLPYPDEYSFDEKLPILRFIYISRIMKEKGINEFLEAAKYIRRTYSFTRFYIIGFCEENFKAKLKEYEETGIVTYIGMQLDIRPFLEQCHCLVHPSYYPEGISNVCLESAASGRPVITTLHSGCKETVDDGVTGFLVMPQNVDCLIDGIKKFIALSHEDKIKMGLNARKKMEHSFDRNVVVDSYMLNIRRLVNDTLNFTEDGL